MYEWLLNKFCVRPISNLDHQGENWKSKLMKGEIIHKRLRTTGLKSHRNS